MPSGAGALFAVSLAACGIVDSATGTVFQVEAVRVRASADANTSSATPVDMVFVYDEGLIASLQSVTATEWFDRRRQFLRDFPDGLKVKSWEIVPASNLAPWEVPEDFLENERDDDAVAAFVFADYLSPGAHRARLESQFGLLIDLQRDDFALGAFNPDS